MNRKKYQRLSKKEIKLIKKLTLERKSLRNVAKITGLTITTIYYQVRKFKPKQKREFSIKLNDEETGELIGAFAGDGSYYHSCPTGSRSSHYRIKYTLSLYKDLKYAEHIKRLLEKTNLNVFLLKSISNNTVDVLVNSKCLISFIKNFLLWDGRKTYTVRLRLDLKKYSRSFIIGFARGLMDTEGFVEVSNVSCACTSKSLIKNLTGIFDILNIKYKLSERTREGRHKLFLIRVYKKSLKKYFNYIGFSNKYKSDALKRIIMGPLGFEPRLRGPKPLVVPS